DALVDVVGSVAGLAALGVERVFFSPLRLGYGTIRCAHGILPIPAPAVAELVKGVPVYAGEVEGEMVTPTGAALATTLAQSFGPMPRMRPVALGLGAGSADRVLPNILRLFIGEGDSDAEESRPDELTVLEANLDDMNPEFYEYLCDLLRDHGALDVWLAPIQMKKGRPAVLLSILARPEEAPLLREIVFRESTTLGLRSYQVERYALARESMEIRLGEQVSVRVKIGRSAGRIYQVAPEYEDCREAAGRLSWPLKRVYQEAVSGAWAVLGRPGDRA
ncbi:MAG: LarC family nickel insertion protein, partial [Bacteroidota bacterium]